MHGDFQELQDDGAEIEEMVETKSAMFIFVASD